MGRLFKSIVLLLSILVCASAQKIHSPEEIAKREQLLKHADTFADIFISEFVNFTRTGIKTPQLEGMYKLMQIPKDFTEKEIDDLEPEGALASCLACRTTFALMLSQYRSGSRTVEQLTEDMIGICQQVTSYSPSVCDGFVRKFEHILVYIIDNRPTLTATQICSLILQPTCGDPDQLFSFTVNISPGQPITGPKTVFSPRSSNELKILHLTDLHYQPSYLVGGIANCPDPLCCRRADGISPNPADRAGQWGDYRTCGSPWQTVEHTIRAAHAQHPDADMVYVTGDYVDHGIWETTQQGNVQIFDRIYGMLKTVFGNKPVFVVLGNHEAEPSNQFAPPHVTDPRISTQWLYNHAATSWSHWLPASAQTTIRRGGYYTTLSPDSKLRIIGLNNNECTTNNAWHLYSTSSAAEQLQWFHDTLLAAERAGEHVHVLTHIASGGQSCSRWWSREYRRIIDRFHRIIGGQFFGHTHQDELMIYYARDQHRVAINAGWRGGATTAHSGTNPNYIVYYVDRTHYQVVEKESWFYDLTEANLNPATSPVWRRQYQFTQHFGLSNLSPATMDNFVTNTLSRSRRLLNDYFRFRYSDSQFIIGRGCSDNCLRNSLCRIVNNEASDDRKCSEINNFPLS